MPLRSPALLLRLVEVPTDGLPLCCGACLLRLHIRRRLLLGLQPLARLPVTSLRLAPVLQLMLLRSEGGAGLCAGCL